MSDAPPDIDDLDDWGDLEDFPMLGDEQALPAEDQPVSEKPPGSAKGAPVQRTAKQVAAAEKAAEEAAKKKSLTEASAAAQRTAQVANLLIAGASFEEIGASIGMTAPEVEKMLMADTNRFIRTQPALRAWVRNLVSAKTAELLEAVFPMATDPKHIDFLPAQDRAAKHLVNLARLHGAEAPTQTEIKMETSPESVQSMVDRIAAAAGRGYDASVFDEDDDVMDGDVVEDQPPALEAGETDD